MIGINIILKLYRKFLLAFAYRNFLWNTISFINFIKKIKGMGFSMTVQLKVNTDSENKVMVSDYIFVLKLVGS